MSIYNVKTVAVTVTQKTILSAFGISEDHMKQAAERISLRLKEAEKTLQLQGTV